MGSMFSGLRYPSRYATLPIKIRIVTWTDPYVDDTSARRLGSRGIQGIFTSRRFSRLVHDIRSVMASLAPPGSAYVSSESAATSALEDPQVQFTTLKELFRQIDSISGDIIIVTRTLISSSILYSGTDWYLLAYRCFPSKLHSVINGSLDWGLYILELVRIMVSIETGDMHSTCWVASVKASSSTRKWYVCAEADDFRFRDIPR